MNIVKSDIISLHGAAISRTGGRPENQDDMAFMDTPLGFLFVICDGMGGGPGGKTASYIVKQVIVETLCECSPQTPRDYALKMAAARAHEILENKMTETPSLSGMGSTFVAVLINDQSAIVAHAGDSRCYKLHGRKCLYRSQDHSLVAELVNKKVMTEEDARLSPQANVITRGLGSTNNHVPEIEEIPYKKGDRFVLCTDGVWGTMPHDELIGIFSQTIDFQTLLSDLSDRIDKIGFSKGGGHDNHTIAIFEMEKDSIMKNRFFQKMIIIVSIIVLCVFALFLLFKGCLNKKKYDFDSKQNHYGTIKISTPTYVEEKKLNNETPHNSALKEEVKQDTGMVSNNNKTNAKWEIDAVVSGEYAEEQKSDSIMNTEKSARSTQSTSTINKDITQEIVDCLCTAKNVKDKDLKVAQKQMGEIHDKVLQLTEMLKKQTTNKRALHYIGEFEKNISKRKLWLISDKNAEGFYCTLHPRVIEKYSGDMLKIKEILSNKGTE